MALLLEPARILFYLANLRARGLAPRKILQGTQLTEKGLRASETVVTQHDRERIVRNMLDLTGRQELALELGLSTSAADLGMRIFAPLSARTIRGALELCGYGSDTWGHSLPIRIEELGNDAWEFVFDEAGTPGGFDSQELVGLTVAIGRMLGGAAFVLRECHFACSPPPDWAAYERLLGCRIRFGAVRTRVRPAGPGLDHPLPGHDAELHAACMKHLAETIRRRKGTQPTAVRLRTLLMTSPIPLPSLEESAITLGMSSRTLRRHLANENLCYQGLVDDIRLDLAKIHLLDDRRPIKSVARELGYHDVSAFRRAFKSWTGQTIGGFLSGAGE